MTRTKLTFVESGETDITERKKQLRSHMKERRGENENRDMKEGLLIENFFKLLQERYPSGLRGKSGLIYLSFSSEAPTDKLISSCEQAGICVYCPRIENGAMFAVAKGEDFTLSAYGIREPVGKISEKDVDFVVTPLLAVDTNGNRLGYGGGYYDRYFKEYPKAYRIGYCYDFQLLHGVPTEREDEPLDAVVTELRTVYTNAR